MNTKQKKFLKKNENLKIIMPPITINSGKLLVTDPSYGKDYIDSKMNLSLVLNVKKGKWKAYKEEREVDLWGWRIIRLVLVHMDHTLEEIERVGGRQVAGNIGVDSGCAGMYDFDDFPEENWMDNLDFGLDKDFSAVKYGVTSHSGLGDGSYDVYKVNRMGKTVFVEIEFINEQKIEMCNKVLERQNEK